MLCEKCGAYAQEDAITCDVCGTLLKRKPRLEPGVRGIRQGKPSSTPVVLPGDSRSQEPKVYDDLKLDVPASLRNTSRGKRGRGTDKYRADAGRPQSRRGIPRVAESEVRKLRVRYEKVRPVKKRMVNWMLVLVIISGLVVLSLVGGFLYLTRSAAGQRILARMGRDATAQAFWQVGEEYMDEGHVEKAITAFITADEKDPDNVDGMLALAAAYEAAGLEAEAEATYKNLYEEVAPTRPQAYQNQIRLLLYQDRTPEAADLMKLAYEKTGLASFRLQREQTIPNMPKTDLSAGRYNEEKIVNLVSPQDYDIYYLIGEGELPKDGTLYKEPIHLGEGSHALKAICVSGNLTSDPLQVTYHVVMPSPDAPKASLAPNTYERQQRVRLRYPGKDKVEMYYTIDGSIPDTNSPRYTGDPIYLPGGRVTLRAIAVNEKGKASNVMEVGYKIQNVPFRMMYSEEDVFTGFTLMKTTREEFLQKSGQPISQEAVIVEDINGECQKAVFDWGYAIFANLGQWTVVEVHQTDEKFAPPRKTHIGSSVKEITDQFRDMGQPENADGSRSLYFDVKGLGIINLISDKQKEIMYTFTTVENAVWKLIYHVTGDTVTAITHTYVP